MKITRITTWPLTLDVLPEFFIVSSAGAHSVSRYVLLAIETDTGLVGWGEATVMPLWSGETQAGAKALIDEYFAPMLLGRDPREFQSLAAAMETIIDNPFTKAAVEMALLDLVGKSAGEPLYKVLGGKQIRDIPIKFSIGLREPENAASIALGKVRQGFHAIKVKVGPDSARDYARTAAVREAIGPAVQLTIDVNGGWSVEQALREIPRYQDLGVAYVEQPTPRWDIEGMAKVRKGSNLPIMADESVFAPWQAEQVIAKQAADLISIYPGKNGGILRSIDIAKKAAAAGLVCHIGSNLEWDIGTAAMCHVVCACDNVDAQRYPVDILGPLYYAVRPQKPLKLEHGKVTVPELPGLGLDLEWSEVERLSTPAARRDGAPGDSEPARRLQTQPRA